MWVTCSTQQTGSVQAESPSGSYEELGWLKEEGGKMKGLDGPCALFRIPSKWPKYSGERGPIPRLWDFHIRYLHYPFSQSSSPSTESMPTRTLKVLQRWKIIPLSKRGLQHLTQRKSSTQEEGEDGEKNSQSLKTGRVPVLCHTPMLLERESFSFLAQRPGNETQK